MISGTISLYDRSGELIDSKEYKGDLKRKEILGDWKTKYGRAYETCFIQISPFTPLHPLVNEDGTNKKSHYNIQKL